MDQTIDESATQLLHHLGKKGSDTPFIYLLDLRENKEYFLGLNKVYARYRNLYDFIKALIITIEKSEDIKSDTQSCREQILSVELADTKREQCLSRKRRQLLSIHKDLLEVQKYLNSEDFNNEQKFYLESISTRRRYELLFL